MASIVLLNLKGKRYAITFRQYINAYLAELTTKVSLVITSFALYRGIVLKEHEHFGLSLILFGFAIEKSYVFSYESIDVFCHRILIQR